MDNWFASISAVRLSHQARLAHAPILVRRPYAETQQSPRRWPALAAYLVYHAFRAPSGFFLAAHTDLRARDLSPKLLFPLVRLLAASMVPPIHSTRAPSLASSFFSILCLCDASRSSCAALCISSLHRSRQQLQTTSYRLRSPSPPVPDHTLAIDYD